MNRRVLVVAVGVVVLGVLAAIILVSRDSDDGSSEPGAPTETGAPTEQECAEAADTVETATANIAQIATTSDAEQDATYFAALVVEQRTITFVMETRPDCFTLAERAGAEGLLEGFRGLLAAAWIEGQVGIVPNEAPPENESGE